MDGYERQESDPDDAGRLFVVANRLPVSITLNKEGDFEYKFSSGGLVSGLKSLSASTEFLWFGWPGFDVHRRDKDDIKKTLSEQHGAVPVFLSQDLADKHYNGFASTTRPHGRRK